MLLSYSLEKLKRVSRKWDPIMLTYEEKKEKVTEFLKKVTHSCKHEQLWSTKTLSPKARKIQGLINSGCFDSYSEDMAKFASFLFGEEITYDENVNDNSDIIDRLKMFCVIVNDERVPYIFMANAKEIQNGFYYLSKNGRLEKVHTRITDFATSDEIIETVNDDINEETIKHFDFLFI